MEYNNIYKNHWEQKKLLLKSAKTNPFLQTLARKASKDTFNPIHRTFPNFSPYFKHNHIPFLNHYRGNDRYSISTNTLSHKYIVSDMQGNVIRWNCESHYFKLVHLSNTRGIRSNNTFHFCAFIEKNLIEKKNTKGQVLLHMYAIKEVAKRRKNVLKTEQLKTIVSMKWTCKELYIFNMKFLRKHNKMRLWYLKQNT